MLKRNIRVFAARGDDALPEDHPDNFIRETDVIIKPIQYSRNQLVDLESTVMISGARLDKKGRIRGVRNLRVICTVSCIQGNIAALLRLTNFFFIIGCVGCDSKVPGLCRVFRWSAMETIWTAHIQTV
jgi:hypothetical protein